MQIEKGKYPQAVNLCLLWYQECENKLPILHPALQLKAKETPKFFGIDVKK